MSAVHPAKRQLKEAIERLRDDIDRVEFWIDALDRLTQPIPDYRPSDRLMHHLLPAHRNPSNASHEH